MAMSGSRGLAVQRLFWNDTKGELVTVLWLGQGLGGWPGVAHGGAIATVLEEALRQVAVGIDKDWTSLPEEPNTLNLSYVKPTLTNNFYVVRVTHSAEQVKKRTGIDPRQPADSSPLTQEVDAILESLEGRTLVKARGTFRLPTAAQAKTELHSAGKSTWQTLVNNIIPKWST
ncbi:MAG: hypothetical protein M1822_005304 [Bathelium mastoideum]|nr:MAG: hypothetical protein M1822_005304 [Bathelium mastoideum]